MTMSLGQRLTYPSRKGSGSRLSTTRECPPLPITPWDPVPWAWSWATATSEFFRAQRQHDGQQVELSAKANSGAYGSDDDEAGEGGHGPGTALGQGSGFSNWSTEHRVSDLRPCRGTCGQGRPGSKTQDCKKQGL